MTALAELVHDSVCHAGAFVCGHGDAHAVRICGGRRRPGPFDLGFPVVVALLDALLDRLLPRRAARRTARRRRERARPAWANVARWVVGGVVVRLILERMFRPGVRGELRHPEEAGSLVAEKVDALRARSYEDLAAVLSPGRRILGVRSSDNHIEDEELRGASGTEYQRTTSLFRDGPGASISVQVRVIQSDNEGWQTDRFTVTPR